MRSYLKNSIGEFICYSVGWVPVVFKTEQEAIDWCMETAPQSMRERYYKARGCLCL